MGALYFAASCSAAGKSAKELMTTAFLSTFFSSFLSFVDWPQLAVLPASSFLTMSINSPHFPSWRSLLGQFFPDHLLCCTTFPIDILCCLMSLATSQAAFFFALL